MKRTRTVLLCAILLIFQLSACGDQNDMDRLYEQNTPSEAVSVPVSSSPSADLSGELVLKIYDDYYWKHWIPKFEKAYPGVTVTTIGKGADAETYAQQTMVELMSGSLEYDLLDLWYLPIHRCAESGLFEDLLSDIKADDSINIGDLYPGIVSASTVNGQIASIPLAFHVIALRVNPSYVDISSLEDDRVTFHDLYQSLQNANQPDLFMVENNNNAYLFFQTELSANMDEVQKKTTVNTPEFIEFLEQMKSVNWNTQNYADGESTGLSDIGSYKKGADFLDIDANALSMMIDEHLITPPEAELLSRQSESASQPILFTSNSGQADFDAIVGPIGIPAASENKELAWAFIRYFLFEMDCEGMIPYEGEEPYWGPAPVNRVMANQLMEATFGEDTELITKLDGWFSTVDTYSLLTINQDLATATSGIFTEYLRGDTMSAEACAQLLEEKIEFYFKE